MTPSRPHCAKPIDCAVKGKGHCRSCHMRAATKANWQDPAFREKQAAAVKANWQDPAGVAREKAEKIIAAAEAEAAAFRQRLEPVLSALGIPADINEWEIARRIHEAAANLTADSRVAKVEAALANARRALDAVVLLREDAA